MECQGFTGEQCESPRTGYTDRSFNFRSWPLQNGAPERSGRMAAIRNDGTARIPARPGPNPEKVPDYSLAMSGQSGIWDTDPSQSRRPGSLASMNPRRDPSIMSSARLRTSGAGRADQMTALQLVAPQRLEMGSIPDPKDPGAGEVLVRLRACGVCGSDMHAFTEGMIAGTPAVYPSVLGHEPAGEVVELGKGVADLPRGAKVAVEPFVVRKECEFTRSGRQNLALAADFMGREIPGSLREFVVMPRRNLVRMPDSMTFADAAFIEPLAVLLHSYELAGLRMGESVAVIGTGPIGLIAVALAKISGASTIVAADRLDHRLERARALGADAAVNVTRGSAAEAVMDLTGCGAHVVIDGAGKPDSINAGLACLRPGGRMVIVGIPSESSVPVNLWTALDREATIHVQKRSNGNDHEALKLLERGLIHTGDIISHRFPLERGQEAFETMAGYRDGIIKPLIEW